MTNHLHHNTHTKRNPVSMRNEFEYIFQMIPNKCIGPTESLESSGVYIVRMPFIHSTIPNETANS